MAEGEDRFTKSLQKLDDELTCNLCKQHFREPKILPCLHYYCKTCIADLIKSAEGRTFNCPECSREAEAEENDLENFPAGLFVNRMEEVFTIMKKAVSKDEVKCESCSLFPAIDFCHDCSEFICTKCSEAHKHMHLLSSHKVISINSLRSTLSQGTPEKLHVAGQEMKCSKHTSEPLKLYCQDCHKLVCRDCTVIDHKDHRYVFVVDAAPQYKAEMKEKAESVRKISNSLKEAVESLKDSKKKLSDHETDTRVAVDEAVEKVVTQVHQKKDEMKAKASEMVSEAVEKVSEQEKNAELAVGEVGSLLEFMSRSLETATDQELLSMEKQMSDQVDRVSSLYSDPAGKFAVPDPPELVIHCGPSVQIEIESEIYVVDKKGKMLTTISFTSPSENKIIKQKQTPKVEREKEEEVSDSGKSQELEPLMLRRRSRSAQGLQEALEKLMRRRPRSAQRLPERPKFRMRRDNSLKGSPIRRRSPLSLPSSPSFTNSLHSLPLSPSPVKKRWLKAIRSVIQASRDNRHRPRSAQRLPERPKFRVRRDNSLQGSIRRPRLQRRSSSPLSLPSSPSLTNSLHSPQLFPSSVKKHWLKKSLQRKEDLPQTVPSLSDEMQNASKDDVLRTLRMTEQALRNTEEENARLHDYIDGLLAKIIDKHPYLLEIQI